MMGHLLIAHFDVAENPSTNIVIKYYNAFTLLGNCSIELQLAHGGGSDIAFLQYCSKLIIFMLSICNIFAICKVAGTIGLIALIDIITATQIINKDNCGYFNVVLTYFQEMVHQMIYEFIESIWEYFMLAIFYKETF